VVMNDIKSTMYVCLMHIIVFSINMSNPQFHYRVITVKCFVLQTFNLNIIINVEWVKISSHKQYLTIRSFVH